ncbi:MAG: TonB-dependent receptor [Bacteroides sp.]|nr:TonB-dependent receptor [Bacteroides sp.]
MKKKPLLRGAFHFLLLSFICLLSPLNLFAQNMVDIRGQILDATLQEPLIGVSVVEKGTTNGVITDLDGNFTLRVNSNSTVSISYMGYLTIELPANKIPATILLKEDSKVLDEVVVVGYGIQKKVNLSGSVSAIDGDVIASKPASDVLTALQGELPGVAVLRTSGEPGSETSGMRIRGYSSLNKTETLVLIDGVEGDLTLVNPGDIESISVLKDAAASAIYGARAAAGVVLVTTKNGQSGKPKISYNGYFAVNTPGNMPERLPAWEEQRFIDESRINTGGSPEWSEEQGSWIGNPNFNYRPNPNGRWDFFEATNWVDAGTRDYTTQHNHSISVSGGSKDLNYLISGNYYQKNGLLKYGPDGNERFNLRAKINSDLNKYMSLSLNVSYQGSFTEASSFGAKNVLERLYRVRGRQPIYNPEEDINDNPYNGDLQTNAIDIMKNAGASKKKYEAFTGKGTLVIKDLVKGLRLNLSASRKAGYYSEQVTKRHLVWNDRLGTTVRFQVNSPNELKKKKNSDYQDLFEAIATYDMDFGKHSFSILGGASYENYKKDEIEGTAKNLLSNDFFSFNYYDTSVAGNSTLKDNIPAWSMMSYFGRINYNFNDRYLLEANLRYDGSSRLNPDKRWKAFPSFSGAWRINEEKWFNVEAISNLKARASWGQLGNGAVMGEYDYLTLMSNNVHLGESYYYQDVLASKYKTWEIIQTTNIGIDLGLFNNKLNITADYYWKYNNNMLINVNLPEQIGIKVPKANIGDLKVWGWEFEIGWKDKIKEVSYQVSFNISDSDNKLTNYNGTNLIEPGTVEALEGYPINTIWGYKTDGYWKSRDEYLKFKEANPGYSTFQDGKIAGGDVKYVSQRDNKYAIGAGDKTPDSPGDLVCLGNTTGRYLYGLNLGVQWKNFDFSMMFQGVAKRKVLVEAGTMAPLSQTSLMPWTVHRDYWTEDNQNAYWPRLYNYNNQETFNFHPSDKWVQDASYIRLKNVTLRYTIPVRKNIMERLRVYVSGADVWEHTNMLSVFDPEVENKVKANYYPFFRTWTVGLNVTF